MEENIMNLSEEIGNKMAVNEAEVTEMAVNEMEDVVGGKMHFKPEKDKPGWIQHKVGPHDTLIRIANHYSIGNWRQIISWNPHINRQTNMIRTGEYLWIKR